MGGFTFDRPGLAIGKNPPNGVVVPYYFRHKPGEKDSVKLEFLDGKGTLIRSFTHREEGKGTGDSEGQGGSGADEGPSIPADSGMNRFVWDMRYPDAHGIEGGTFLAGGSLRGPIALPGTYQVRLKAGSDTHTQSLRIVADPRSQATAAELQEQFDLLIMIRDKVSAMHDAVNDIVRMRKALASRKDAGAQRQDAALEAVLKELVELRFVGYDDQMLVFDLKLNNRMAALQGYVSQGDYAPTEQQYSVFRSVSSLVDAALARYTALKAQTPSP